MSPARVIILVISLTAGGLAAYLVANTGEPPPAPAPIVQAPSVRTTEVLVVASEVPLGAIVTPSELRWQVWPSDAVATGMITKPEQPNAVTDLAGSIARLPILAGEPVRRERLVRADGNGVLSALLPAGSRAVAITIDNRGANTAGNFILPNDRVDLIRVFRDEAASKQLGQEVVSSETFMRNVRILAIGQNIQERNGEKVVVGETATLELDPRQVEIVTAAQRAGQISMSLRSLQDAAKTVDVITKPEETTLNIVRYGASSQR